MLIIVLPLQAACLPLALTCRDICGSVITGSGKSVKYESEESSNEVFFFLVELKEMAERIIAVDQAATIVEEMLKSGHNSQPVSSSFQAMANSVVKITRAKLPLNQICARQVNMMMPSLPMVIWI